MAYRLAPGAELFLGKVALARIKQVSRAPFGAGEFPLRGQGAGGGQSDLAHRQLPQIFERNPGHPEQRNGCVTITGVGHA